MAHLVGREVELPADIWEPKSEKPSLGRVKKYLPPTKTYPAGRLEIYLSADRQSYLFDADKIPEDWSKSPPPPQSATKRGSGRNQALPGLETKTGHNAVKHKTAELQSPERRQWQPPHGSGTASNKLEPGATPQVVEALGNTPSTARRRSMRLAGLSPVPGEAGPAPVTPQAPAAPAPTVCDQLTTQVPAYHPARLPLWRNAVNFTVMVAVAVPAIVFGWYLSHQCTKQQWEAQIHSWWPQSLAHTLSPNYWCALGYQQPIAAVNVVFFLNVNVLFWTISLIQGHTWLIDPYWTIAPVLLGFFYYLHPTAVYLPLRSAVSMGLLLLWSIRLTWSYLRREAWQFGAREDWRFTDLARKYPRNWWWMSFFLTYFVQQLMLVGITLPLAAVHSSIEPWNWLDTAATVGCCLGLSIAFKADNDLRAFMLNNESLAKEGRPPLQLLETGLWYYSRHPNYFGEIIWWTSLAVFAWRLGQPWMLAGTAFNTACLMQVVGMTEARMLRKPSRTALYRRYQDTTSCLFPWFKRHL